MLVILSGGQDSTTVLYMMKQVHKEVHAITFDYGQRHDIEIMAARKIAAMANVNLHKIVNVRDVLEFAPLLLVEFMSWSSTRTLSRWTKLLAIVLRKPLFPCETLCSLLLQPTGLLH